MLTSHFQYVFGGGSTQHQPALLEVDRPLESFATLFQVYECILVLPRDVNTGWDWENLRKKHVFVGCLMLIDIMFLKQITRW